MAAGWDCIGVDVEDMGGYPGRLVLADVREVAKDPQAFFPGVKFSLVTASPPCQEFSYRSFPFKRCRYLRDNVPPDTSIWKACEEIARKLGVPLVLENVRGAVRYMGPAMNKFGPFYLWGDVPALLPDGKPQKGFGKVPGTGHLMNQGNRNRTGNAFQGEYERVNGLQYESRGKRGPLDIQRAEKHGYKRMVGSEKYSEFNQGETAHASSKSSARKEWSAKAAMIPWELGYFIGCHFAPKVPAAARQEVVA